MVAPIKYGFKRSFRIIVLIIKFIIKCRKGNPFRGPKLSSPLGNISPIHLCDSLFESSQIVIEEAEKPADPRFNLSPQVKQKLRNMLDNELMKEEEYCTKLAMTYLFRTATDEVKKFAKAETVEKIAMESEGILFSKNRLLESMEFKIVSEMEMVDLDPLGINTRTPIIDRYSPLAYAIAQHIHYIVSGHAGLETCNSQRVFFLQGVSLYREISAECIKCKIKRRRFLEMSMGPIGQHNLTIAPPFHACQADLHGVCT